MNEHFWTLRETNTILRDINISLRLKNTSLRVTNTRLRDINISLHVTNTSLQVINVTLRVRQRRTVWDPLQLDVCKLYRMVRNQFPFLMRKEIQKWTESNLSYSLHNSCRGAFEWNKEYAPEIECHYSRKQATLFYHRVVTIHKEAQHLLKSSIKVNFFILKWT